MTSNVLGVKIHQNSWQRIQSSAKQNLTKLGVTDYPNCPWTSWDPEIDTTTEARRGGPITVSLSSLTQKAIGPKWPWLSMRRRPNSHYRFPSVMWVFRVTSLAPSRSEAGGITGRSLKEHKVVICCAYQVPQQQSLPTILFLRLSQAVYIDGTGTTHWIILAPVTLSVHMFNVG